MAVDDVKQMVTFRITNCAVERDHQIVRFYLNVPSPTGKITRFNVRSVIIPPTEGQFTNITFLYNNLFDIATVTASSNHRKFPPSRIQHRWGTYHWRSWADPFADPKPDALANQWIKADLGAPKDVKAFLVWYHNFCDGAIVDTQANGADVWGAPTLDENITLYDTTYPIVKLWTTPKTFQWWRLSVDGDWSNIITEGDFNGAHGYLDYARIGRIFIGDYFRPESNFNRAYVLAKEDGSVTFPTLEDQIVSNVKPRYATMAFEFEDLSASDFAKFMIMWNTVGTTVPFWIVQNVGRWYDQTYYVVNADKYGFKRKPGTEKYDLKMVVEEVS